MRVGLISDTHGRVRPEVFEVFEHVDLILHAGDVGGPGVLVELAAIAPVRAVAGNVDPVDGGLPSTLDIELEGVRVHVSHGHEVGAPTPLRMAARSEADIIVFGHTHKPLVQRVGKSLVVNPGAAGPARFNLQPSVALLTLPARDARIVWLQPPGS
jgi:uncharacterized protein